MQSKQLDDQGYTFIENVAMGTGVFVAFSVAVYIGLCNWGII